MDEEPFDVLDEPGALTLDELKRIVLSGQVPWSRLREVVHNAAAEGRWDMVVWLAEQGVGLNGSNWEGSSILQVACSFQDDVELVKLLISKGAEVTFPVFKAAVEHSTLEMVEFLLGNGGLVTNEILFCAMANERYIEVLQVLLRDGLDLSPTDSWFHSDSVFQMLTQWNIRTDRYLDICHFLISRGFRVDEKSMELFMQDRKIELVRLAFENCDYGLNYRPKVLATFFCDKAVKKEYFKESLWESLLRTFAQLGDVKSVDTLLERGLKVDAQSRIGKTALMNAAEERHIHVVEHLLSRGARLDIKNRYNQTALCYACDASSSREVPRRREDRSHVLVAKQLTFNDTIRGIEDSDTRASSIELVELLLQHAAAQGVLENVCTPALETTCRSKHCTIEKVQLLLENGADGKSERAFLEACRNWTVNDETSAKVVQILLQYGAGIESSLRLVSIDGKAETARVLLEHGANVHLKDKTRSTPLIYAARSGSADTCRVLLQKGAETEAMNREGNTALLVACKHWKHEAARILLQHGADARVQARDGSSSLMLACTSPETRISLETQLELAQLLIDNGVDIHHQNKLKETALSRACAGKNTALVKLLLDNGADAHSRTGSMETCLIHACKFCSDDTIQLLIDIGVEIDAQDIAGDTALHHACKRQAKSVMKLLLESGADPNLQNNDGVTAFMALFHNHLDPNLLKLMLNKGADLLVKDKDGTTALVRLARYTHQTRYPYPIPDMLQHLRHFPGLESTTSSTGETLVMYACQAGCFTTVDLLLERGASIRATNSEGRTPLMFAAQKGYKNILKTILEKGPEVNAQSNDGRTALMVACEASRGYVVKLLLKYGADCNVKDLHGNTALTFACANKTNSVMIIQHLLASGADILASHCHPLIFAARSGNCCAVRFFVSHGASVHTKDANDNTTALMAAAEKGHTPIVSFLLRNGCDVNAQNTSQLTALDLACREGHIDIVHLLLESGANRVGRALRIAAKFASKHLGCRTLPLLKLLLENGADVLETDEDGDTALMLWCFQDFCGCEENLDLLINYGSDIFAQNKFGWTALSHAASSINSASKLPFLLKHGLSVSAELQSTESFLSVACRGGNAALVSEIIKNGADVNQLCTEEVGTPLENACWDVHTPLVRLLYQHGANLEYLFADGLDALEVARKVALIARSALAAKGKACVSLLEFLMQSDLARVLELELGLSRAVVLEFYDWGIMSIEDCRHLTDEDLLHLGVQDIQRAKKRFKKRKSMLKRLSARFSISLALSTTTKRK